MSIHVPKVSVGVPVYNGERYLHDCLKCLLEQSFEDFEIVISDNASTDDTESICRHYAAIDSRIHYHRQDTNRGANWNFNQVFHLSQGEYFKWAAVDDLCDKHYLQKATECLDDHPSCICCHSLTVHIGEFGRRFDANPRSQTEDVHSLLRSNSRLAYESADASRPAKRFSAVLLGTTWCSDAFGLIRRKYLSETALEGPYYGAEKVLMAELALRGQFIEIPEVLFYQRVHPDASGEMQCDRDRERFTFGIGSRQGRCNSLALLRGYVEAVQRAKLSPRERAFCYGHLIRYACQFRKLFRKMCHATSSLCTSYKSPLLVKR